nr:3-dehydroquinate synthase [Gemmatimonadaceae bacterium]
MTARLDADAPLVALDAPVHVGHALLDELPRLVPALAVDALHGARVRDALGDGRTLVLTLPPGEQAKTRETWGGLTDAMLVAGIGRDAIVLALGGGVIGDLAGFVAATYLRGIPVVQCPTTLLAMVDAAIGGKTAVDTPMGKNLVGAFHAPLAVVADLDTLATLPARERAQGLAEALKHGVIADRAYWDAVVRALPWPADADALHALVHGSAAIKCGVVARDPHEHGERAILNFGHTIAHAIERATDYAIAHGEAVAIGMIVEATIAVRTGVGTAEVLQALRSRVRRCRSRCRAPSTSTSSPRPPRVTRRAVPASCASPSRRRSAGWHAPPRATGCIPSNPRSCVPRCTTASRTHEAHMSDATETPTAPPADTAHEAPHDAHRDAPRDAGAEGVPPARRAPLPTPVGVRSARKPRRRRRTSP